MTPRTPALVAAIASLAIGTAHGQTCTEPHYRWSEKVDTSFATNPPTAVDVSDILTWTPRTITAKDECAPRIGRERNVYAVTAFVRRIKLHETDGDWHVEITEEEYTPPRRRASSSRSRRRHTAISTARRVTSSLGWSIPHIWPQTVTWMPPWR